MQDYFHIFSLHKSSKQPHNSQVYCILWLQLPSVYRCRNNSSLSFVFLPTSFCNLFHRRMPEKNKRHHSWERHFGTSKMLHSLFLCRRISFYHICHNRGFVTATIISKINNNTQEKTTQIHVKNHAITRLNWWVFLESGEVAWKNFALIISIQVNSCRLILLKLNNSVWNEGQKYNISFLSIA